MADQFNDSIPAVTNQITEDVADIAETLGFIKDVFQNFCYNWSNTVATQIFPNKMDDDDEVLINIAGSEVISVNAAGYDVLGVPQGLDVTAALHRKIVEIGDWNMVTTGSVNVAHGLTIGKIRRVDVNIRNDSGTLLVNLITQTTTSITGGYNVTGTNVECYRVSTWGANFQNTGYNRGWIVIDYVD